MDINETIKDLVAEQQALDNVVAQLDDQMWTTPTSSAVSYTHLTLPTILLV